jgi:hypothetical protein
LFNTLILRCFRTNILVASEKLALYSENPYPKLYSIYFLLLVAIFSSVHPTLNAKYPRKEGKGKENRYRTKKNQGLVVLGPGAGAFIKRDDQD